MCWRKGQILLPFKELLESLNFEEFCRRTKCKWHFRNDVSETFSKIPTLEKQLFTDDLDEPLPSNLSAEEWKALRKFPSNGSTLIKGTDKDSSAVFLTTYQKLKNILMTNWYIRKLR